MLLTYKKAGFLTVLICFFGVELSAQFPTTCFEIESILVDACGTPEGENEMVRFATGPNPLDVANMTVTWPNNVYRGICQNATTAAAVSSLNDSIQSCGILIEPAGGILPANSNILLVTSEDIDVLANSFANLSDTLYIIFQCAGNTTGHFANWNATPGLRTLIIDFNPPVGCADTVTYDRTVLVNQLGMIGGSSAIRNGAFVNFDFPGNPTYDNVGCQAPFVAPDVQASALTSATLCSGDSIQIGSTYSSPINGITWFGGSGTFGSTSADTTTYFPGVADTGNFFITALGISNCGDTIIDSILVNVSAPSLSNQNATICQGQSFSLPGGGNATTSGIYIDTLVAGSTTGCDSIITTNLTVNPSAQDSVMASICQGQQFLLPGGSNVTVAGIYRDTLTGASAQGCDSIVITNLSVNPVSSSAFTDSICQGQNYTLPGGTQVNTAGIYSDTLSTTLGCDSVITVTLNVNGASVNIVENDTNLCPGESIVIHGNGINLVWSTGDSGIDSITVTAAGIYTLTSTQNGCSAQDQITVSDGDCGVFEASVPNVFTPNRDNNNDLFKVVGFGIEAVAGTIYNRWGQKLYEWVGINDGWNGYTTAAAEAPTGTYFYLIEVSFVDGSSQTLKGSLTLLR